jgi:hypothetical protein
VVSAPSSHRGWCRAKPRKRPAKTDLISAIASTRSSILKRITQHSTRSLPCAQHGDVGDWTS